ncbi:MAG: DUF1611 domain-containing protein, partial [Candidatus Eremiobacteraeota bacterium]|nr:DUF1611 domain-containing protein [Candidatus Eremiobacteraeota bacterium]
MRVGEELLTLAGTADGAVLIVGTGRDAGKTTTLHAMYRAAVRRGLRVAVASVGRDRGSSGAVAKPRLELAAGTVFASARGMLPASPACRILRVTALPSPNGCVLFAAVATDAPYEVTGPPTAAGMREAIAQLRDYSDLVFIDGAVDRVAALAGTNGGVVVAAGAADASTVEEAAVDVGALVARLRVPAYDPREPSVTVDGALTPARASALMLQRESRQVVVNDPTQITLRGRAAIEAFDRLRIRCRRALRVVAATVAPVAPSRHFEPVAFGAAVADATGLPTYDV